MAHIHLQDGTFPLAAVCIWWILALLLIGVALWWLRRAGTGRHRIVLAALLTAAAFAVFQVSIPVLGGVHMNLTPLIGILAGPGAGVLAVFVVNLFSAAVGHGGWGLLGANTLISGAEVIGAYAFFRLFRQLGSGWGTGAGIATFIALILGSLLMIGIVTLSGISGASTGSAALQAGLLFITALNMGVAAGEAILTAAIVVYLAGRRPDILKDR